MDHVLTLSDAQKQCYLKYANLAVPRYTSYPAISSWNDTTTVASFKDHIRNQKAFSLYFHVPFCQKLCFYCGCQKSIMNPASVATQTVVDDYLMGLEIEAWPLARCMENTVIQQLHFGGGTPNFLNVEQWEQLYKKVLSQFNLDKHMEWSVELDPRWITQELLHYLYEIGVNRVSFGIQDFDPKVQKAINRIQSFEQVSQAVEWTRAAGISLINFDLIHGLPFQTEASMQTTLDQVIRLSPDRIANYRLAVLPEMFTAQKMFIDKDLPQGEALLALNMLGINRFLEAGYEFIGLDHFAKADDPLAVAARENKLHRNFQGMTTGADLPLLGFGPSAISMLDDLYVQNPKTIKGWLSMLADPDCPRKSQVLSPDDRIRRSVINQIFAQGCLTKTAFEQAWQIEFDSYFADAIPSLHELAAHGLVTMDAQEIRLTKPLGLLLRRVVAAVFDRYQPWGRGSMVG